MNQHQNVFHGQLRVQGHEVSKWRRVPWNGWPVRVQGSHPSPVGSYGFCTPLEPLNRCTGEFLDPVELRPVRPGWSTQACCLPVTVHWLCDGGKRQQVARHGGLPHHQGSTQHMGGLHQLESWHTERQQEGQQRQLQQSQLRQGEPPGVPPAQQLPAAGSTAKESTADQFPGGRPPSARLGLPFYLFFDGVCVMWNLGKCLRAPGTCTSKKGDPLKHICNHRPDTSRPDQFCGKDHPAFQFHK